MKSTLLIALVAFGATVVCGYNSTPLPKKTANGTEIDSRLFNVGIHINANGFNTAPSQQSMKTPGNGGKPGKMPIVMPSWWSNSHNNNNAKRPTSPRPTTGNGGLLLSTMLSTRRPANGRPTTTTTTEFPLTTPDFLPPDDVVVFDDNVNVAAEEVAPVSTGISPVLDARNNKTGNNPITGQNRSPANVSTLLPNLSNANLTDLFPSLNNTSLSNNNNVAGSSNATSPRPPSNGADDGTAVMDGEDDDEKPNKPGKKPGKKPNKKPNKNNNKPNAINVVFNNNGQNSSASFIMNKKKPVEPRAMWVGNL